MKNAHPGYKTLRVVILILAFASLAHAQATRTWVSGTGNDASPNCTRALPCLTFASAILKTAAGGEIDALDPGDFGVVTIDRAITIDGTTGAGFASIAVPANLVGITITAAATDVVTIRNLSINGANTNNSGGIGIDGAGTVHIENCVVANNGSFGIFDARTGSVNSVFYLYIKDTVSRNSGAFAGGITIAPGFPFSNPGVFIIASLTNVRSQDNATAGVDIRPGVYASLDHCNITGNRLDGLLAGGASGGMEGTASAGVMAVKNSVSSNNGNGVRATPGGIVRISGVQVYDNTIGIKLAGGTISSYGNNEIDGNTTNGAPSNTIPRK
jgi:hypothetical protein